MPKPKTRLAAFLAAAALSVLTTATPARAAAIDGRVDFHDRLQSIDGFGFAEAFQRASVLHGARGLSPAHQREVLDLLFDRRTGAGASILRLGVGSSADNPYDLMRSIQPVDPGGPEAPPRYVWDGDDGGQVWLAQQAKGYGVKRFFADAWSAPGYMKTNGTDTNGGTLCGLPDASCASGDWRQAYADYLAQYARFYAQEGVRITDLNFVNEPDFTATYASMRVTPEQAVDMVKVLGPTLRRSGVDVACCDSFGWNQQAAYSAAIAADPVADRWVRTHTGHNYASQARTPLPTDRPTWMSEWQPSGSTWNEAWDDTTGYAGMVVAEDIHAALTTANASGYLYWLGASIGATRALVQLGADGDEYHVSKRLWAFAAYSRFIRPGAVRVAAEVSDPALKVSAFRNADGSRVLEIINTSLSETTLRLGTAGRAAAYLTDETHALSRVDAARATHGKISVDLAPRSLTTVVLG